MPSRTNYSLGIGQGNKGQTATAISSSSALDGIPLGTVVLSSYKSCSLSYAESQCPELLKSFWTRTFILYIVLSIQLITPRYLADCVSAEVIPADGERAPDITPLCGSWDTSVQRNSEHSVQDPELPKVSGQENSEKKTKRKTYLARATVRHDRFSPLDETALVIELSRLYKPGVVVQVEKQ
jgi:hypothetical protein